MSGIFGLWRLDGRPAEADALERMSESLVHRGPDGAGVWRGGPVGVGHRMLRSTPESLHEGQPLVVNEDLVLTGDVRLDNREELIPLFGAGARQAADVTDAELLLACYRSKGDSCAQHLVGDFAFTVWDAGKRILTAFRDRFGVKPLYYVHIPDRLFAFASDVEALLTLSEVAAEIDEDEVARHLLVPIGSDPSATYYRHVRRLKPAYLLRVTSGGVAEDRYWRLDETRESGLSSVEEHAAALRETFTEAVRCRLRSRSPVAVMLSGGIDSSAITTVAARLMSASGRGPVHTLSAVYPDAPESDERPFIEKVLERVSAIPHSFAADASDPLADIDRINRLVGGANLGFNLYLNWELFGLAADAGAGVVLDGFDGDATISHGRGYLSELAIAGKWLKAARVSVPYSRRRGMNPVTEYLALVRFGRRRRRQGVREARPAVPPPGTAINQDFARRFQGRETSSTPAWTERGIHAADLTSSALSEALGWVETCGAGRGVDVRFPFFDVRVAELALSIPPEQKLRRGWSRHSMRKAMEGILPPEVQWRKDKADLTPGWERAYRTHAAGRVNAILAHPNDAMRRYLDLDRLAALHEKFVARAATRAEMRLMWRALSLALWLSPRDGGQAPIAP